eukprot:scaffold119544_cov22-Prasinocladus_malaysianus.AAC.1
MLGFVQVQPLGIPESVTWERPKPPSLGTTDTHGGRNKLFTHLIALSTEGCPLARWVACLIYYSPHRAILFRAEGISPCEM